MEKRAKPSWSMPINDTIIPDIKLFNSFTNQKETFKPNKGNHVEWYTCGPTVYDTSHMGHARAFISIDILRRVLTNYFKFDVHYVMNITDIDDKIIKRARQNYLFSSYLKENNKIEQIIDDINRALHHNQTRLDREQDPDKRDVLSKDVAAIKAVLSNHSEITPDHLMLIKDSFSDLLDKEQGQFVVDNSIFEDLPKFYEADFMEDMRNLNVLPPDELTRVSEFIPEIIDFVSEIIRKGFAYERNGSVYFDTAQFDCHPDHYYAKLVPNAFGNESLLREGEGTLTTFESGEKRAETDFALWKRSKAGEPSWPSPWGLGRPGWHIECSAMAGARCGPVLDLHSGGVDLKFPHHDNEIAQSEARFSCSQWVNYFLHTGHLTIAGCKMSKSLKNFVSIKQALARHSGRQLRLLFLLHAWRDTLDYSDESMGMAVSYEKMVLDFFFNVRQVCKWHQLHGNSAGDRADRESGRDALEQCLATTRSRIFNALADSVDTREVMLAIKDAITIGNLHYTTYGITGSCRDELRALARQLHEVLHVLGAADEQCQENPLQCPDLNRYSARDRGRILAGAASLAREFVAAIRTASADTDGSSGGSAECGTHVEQLVLAFLDRCRVDCGVDLTGQSGAAAVDACSAATLDGFLDRLACLRQEIRVVAKERRWHRLLSPCDRLRDAEGLASIGVRLQDSGEPGVSCIVGLMPGWTAAETASPSNPGAKKQSGGAPQAKPSKQKLAATVDPRVMFRSGPHEGAFSRYDEDGLPTHDAAGQELSKTRRAKLKKLMGEQRRAFESALGVPPAQ